MNEICNIALSWDNVAYDCLKHLSLHAVSYTFLVGRIHYILLSMHNILF